MSKRIFVFINFPTGSTPYIDKIYKSNQYLESIYEGAKGEYLRKRDLERLGIIFPAGPRYRMLPYELHEHFGPSGPDIIDIANERYMKEQKRLKEEKEKELK